jgi:hypothetical protein
LRLPRSGTAGNGWIEAQEIDGGGAARVQAGGHTFAHHAARRRVVLLVGDERRRSDTILTGVLAASPGGRATLAMGTIGGLWLSAQFLGRIDSMRQPPAASWTATGGGEFR